MANESLTDAIKEAYACAPSNVIVLETLEISNPLLEGITYIVKDNQDHWMKTEDGIEKKFIAVPFKITLPKIGADGLQELTISIDNVSRSISDFVRQCKALPAPTKIQYRPYLSNDLTMPQMSPPLTMYVADSTITVFEVTVRAAFLNYTNKKFPATNQYYNRNRFPSIGQ